MVNKKVVIICSIVALILVAGIVFIQIRMWRTEYDKLEENNTVNTNVVANNVSIENKIESTSATNNQTAENTSSTR